MRAILGGVVVGAALVYVVAGRLIHGPSVFGDELIYMEAARSLAHDGVAMVRDEHYRFGPLYPLVLSPFVRVFGVSGYDAVKAVNAVLFALTALPVYAFARRLVSPRWSAVVAALSVAVPSSMYTALVFTESFAYVATWSALLGMLLALDRPSLRRLAVALLAIVVAAGVRPQLAVLAPVFLLAFALRWVLTPAEARPRLARLWPVGLAAAVVIAILVSVPLTSGSSPIPGLGAYSTLWRSYRPGGVAKWTWYSFGAVALYVAFVPVVLAPAVLRAIRRTDRAFVALFLAANVGMLLLVGAFSSTPYGEDRLHDRYLFYLVPLWLLILALWVDRRPLPLAFPWLAGGAALSLALAVALPPSLLVRDTARQLDGVSTAVWADIRQAFSSHPSAMRALLVLAAAAVAAAVYAVPVRVRALLLLPVVAVFVADAARVWQQRATDANRPVFAGGLAKDWVDRALPPGVVAATLYVASDACNRSLARDAFLQTEFFNGQVGRGLYVGVPSAAGVPSHAVEIRPGGAVVESGGTAVRAAAVIAAVGVDPAGTRVAAGTAARLSLWRAAVPLRLTGAGSDAAVLAGACKGAP